LSSALVEYRSNEDVVSKHAVGQTHGYQAYS
jgi:hypothetical protein